MRCAALAVVLAFFARGGSVPQRFSHLEAPYSADGAYTGPFTLLSSNALDGTADPDNNFGPEDKLVSCNEKLVFIDLDTDGTSPDTVISYSTITKAWTKTRVVANACPDSGQGGLLPRDSGYTVGTTAGPSGDRLLVLGGTVEENNVCEYLAPRRFLARHLHQASRSSFLPQIIRTIAA
jgi:hypothetical protein